MTMAPDHSGGNFWEDLRLLFVQAFSERSLIDAGRYASYDIALGVLVLALAAISRLQVTPSPITETIALAVVGASLLSGLALLKLAPGLLLRWLALQGALIAGLGIALMGSTISWSLSAPPHAQFRYLPGAILLLTLFGSLRWAEFGPWPAQIARLRRGGLALALCAELLTALFLVLRFVR